MKTRDLVTLLASGLEPIDARALTRRRLLTNGVGLGISVAIAVAILRLNPALSHYVLQPMFWAREAYCLALSGVGMAAVGRLGRPSGRLGTMPIAAGCVMVAMWTLAVIALRDAPPNVRPSLLLGSTAAACPFLITLLAVPPFFATFWILREQAPTRFRLAGAAAGFAAGSLAALVYTLHCPEIGAPFLSIWYPAGILIPTFLGSLIAPRALRW